VAKRKSSSDRPAEEAAAKPKRSRAKASAPKIDPDAEGNVIEFAPGLRDGGTLSLGRRSNGKREGQAVQSRKRREAARASPSSQPQRAQPIPESVRERFIQIGNSFFFPDGA
jgi:hypothetical protein